MGIKYKSMAVGIMGLLFWAANSGAAIVGSIDGQKDLKGRVAASSLRPSGELKIFGYVLEKPQVALTSGAKILDLADAKIKGTVRVGPEGAARASIELEAKTSLGMLRLSLDAQGLEGDEFDAPIDVGGVKAIAHVRIAKKDGCAEADCPASLRADYLDESLGASVDIYCPWAPLEAKRP